MKRRDVFLVTYGVLIGICVAIIPFMLLDGSNIPAVVMGSVITIAAWRISAVRTWT